MITYDEMKQMQDEVGAIPDFFNIVKKDLGIDKNPKADELMSVAWEYGHAHGYYEVYSKAVDLVSLISESDLEHLVKTKISELRISDADVRYPLFEGMTDKKIIEWVFSVFWDSPAMGN